MIARGDYMERFKQLREENGYSQQFVAEHLNVSQQAWANYESGKREPSIKILKEIAVFFDVSLDYLLGKTDIKKAPVESDKGDRSAMEQEFIELYRRLAPDQKKTVLALIHALLDDKE
jgi:transcriptional regulator with XRE-family HTH domain